MLWTAYAKWDDDDDVETLPEIEAASHEKAREAFLILLEKDYQPGGTLVRVEPYVPSVWITRSGK